MIVPAYAKLNLTLDVLGVRADGYHEIASVMQTISLHDLLLVEAADCRVFEMTGASIEGENLVLTAARALEAFVGRALPFRMHLDKRIPIGAGLGGGSADAAAFLRVAPRLHGITLTPEQRLEVASAVGQDVAFLLRGGTALASGLGSVVDPLPPLDPAVRFLVVCPRVQVSTATIYAAAATPHMAGARSRSVVAAIRAGGVPAGTAIGNDLEAVTRRVYPDVARAIDRLEAGVPGLHMTGSGAAFFALVEGPGDADQARRASLEAGIPAWICRPVPAWT